jgi:hypothetical protein
MLVWKFLMIVTIESLSAGSLFLAITGEAEAHPINERATRANRVNSIVDCNVKRY